jgi:hypothetical protein
LTVMADSFAGASSRPDRTACVDQAIDVTSR